MTEFLLVMALMAGGGKAEVRIIPRFDGLLMELTADSPITDSISVQGFTAVVRPGMAVGIPNVGIPFWVYGWELHRDSLGFDVQLRQLIDSLSYSLSDDRRTMLLFFRAREPLVFPELSWEGPPEEPAYTLGREVMEDSVLLTTLSSGEESPWLENFDCVVIDPGHGGRDPGAVGPAGTYEKDRALEVALLVRDILSIRRPDLKVIMTRDTDRYMSLGERTRLANAMKADLFISIHCNAATNSSANGFETFFLSRARNDESRAVEMLENSVIELEEEGAGSMLDDPLSFLLADMAQSIYLERSSSLAVEIQRSLGDRFPENISRGVKQAGFYVLRGALMPSVLVELAFISNPEEEQRLRSLDFRLASAEAIVDAVLEFTDRNDGGY